MLLMKEPLARLGVGRAASCCVAWLCVAFCLSGCDPFQPSVELNVEPTEAEMRAAVQGYLDQINKSIEENRRIHLRDNGSGNLPQDMLVESRVVVASFGKLTAAPAPDGLGYICTFDMTLAADGADTLTTQNLIKSMVKETFTGRFLKFDGDWIYQATDDTGA